MGGRSGGWKLSVPCPETFHQTNEWGRNEWDWPTTGTQIQLGKDRSHSTKEASREVFVDSFRIGEPCDGEDSVAEDEEKSLQAEENVAEDHSGDGVEGKDGEGVLGDQRSAEAPATGKKDGDENDDANPTECQAPYIILCDTGKSFGGKHCSKKIKEPVCVLLEDRVMRDGVLVAIPPFDSPITASMCGLHAKKYADRIRELMCNLPTCHGRGFTCVYQGKIFRFCHLHMAEALELEVKNRFQLSGKPGRQPAMSGPAVNVWEDEDLWRIAKGNEDEDASVTKPSVVREEGALKSDNCRAEQSKRASVSDEENLASMGGKSIDGKDVFKNEARGQRQQGWSNQFDDRDQLFGREKRSPTQSLSGPDSAFKRFAQPGPEEDGCRSADLEGLMPNFARRPREKPTYIPVEMQNDYESGAKKREPWDIVAEGFGEIRGNDDKDAKSPTRMSEFLVFSLRGFGFFKIELGIGAYGKDLLETLKRQASAMKESMYRKGIRVPLTNRIAHGLADACWGSEAPGGSPEGSLLVVDFLPWDLHSFEDYVRKGDKVETRNKSHITMNAISRAIKQQIKIFGAVYGEEHASGRTEALSSLEDLRESYEEFHPPTFLMAVWDEMTFEYTMVTMEGIRRLLQPLPKGARRGKLKERALTPKPGGTTAWKSPVTFKMTSTMGFWKSRILPRLERKVERDMLHAAIPQVRGKRAAGVAPTDEPETDPTPGTANSIKSMYPAGRKLTFQEQRDSIPYAPQVNGKALCWDFSSWAGCSWGKECKKLHQTMKIQGLHWLILALLARRGGHVSRTRIPPESVDGYIQALREANNKLENCHNKVAWRPKSALANAGEARPLNPAIGNPPDEIVEVDLAELERDLENVFYADDNWIFDNPAASVDWAKADNLTATQRRVQNWRGASTIPVHGSLETHVLNDLLAVGEPFEEKTARETLKKLATHGCEREKRLSEQALIEFDAERGPASKKRMAFCGGFKRECEAFTGQDMQVGNLHYDVIGFGEDLLVNASTQLAIGAVSREEENQCVLLHLGAALAWYEKGRGKSVPSRGLVFHKAMLARSEEAAQAKDAVNMIGNPTNAREQLIMRHAHDCLQMNHDRNFRGMFFLWRIYGMKSHQTQACECSMWVADAYTMR